MKYDIFKAAPTTILLIIHGSETYRLLRTRKDKLILQK